VLLLSKLTRQIDHLHNDPCWRFARLRDDSSIGKRTCRLTLLSAHFSFALHGLKTTQSYIFIPRDQQTAVVWALHCSSQFELFRRPFRINTCRVQRGSTQLTLVRHFDDCFDACCRTVWLPIKDMQRRYSSVAADAWPKWSLMELAAAVAARIRSRRARTTAARISQQGGQKPQREASFLNIILDVCSNRGAKHEMGAGHHCPPLAMALTAWR